MGGFCLLVELHREGSVPAACAAGLFSYPNYLTFLFVTIVKQSELDGVASLLADPSHANSTPLKNPPI